jgi:hypothetical protein
LLSHATCHRYNLWAPSDASAAAPRPAASLGDGLAQATLFKELLLASQHFRLYSQKTISEGVDGVYGVRFLMVGGCTS